MTRNKARFFRPAAAALLAMIMLLSSFSALAEAAADDSGMIPEGMESGSLPGGNAHTIRPNGSTYDNGSAFNTYINSILYSRTDSIPRSAASSVYADRLNKNERGLYDALMKEIKKVADGESSSTRFTVSFSPKISRNSIDNSQDKMDQKIDGMVRNVVFAMLGDGPCELYWFDKTEGWSWDYTECHFDSNYCWITGFHIEFSVAKEYSAHNSTGSFKTDPSKAKAVRAAAANAKKIVKDNRGKSDTEKLKAYRDAICALTGYNTAAAEDYSIPYGNPWQLIWVFDGNPKTDVVCEGYSKAFQYLCELSAFSGDITCLSVTGYLITPGSQGLHMWNVVKMPDDKHYLVDVTNCDTGASGSDDLFLAGCAGRSSAGFEYGSRTYGKAYVFETGNGLYYYYFDKDLKIYKKSDREFNSSPFNPATDTTKARGTCGPNAEWSLNKGVLKIEGSGRIKNYNSKRRAPWKKYADKIKKIIIGDSITQIGNYAFKGLSAAKSVTVGKKVAKIGQFAFSGCKSLSSFTFRGAKLSTIGKKAFKGIPKKTVFVCPAKKLDAYKKLLLKKGVPNTAVFRK